MIANKMVNATSNGIKQFLFENPEYLEIEKIKELEHIDCYFVSPKFLQARVHGKDFLIKLDKDNLIEKIMLNKIK